MVNRGFPTKVSPILQVIIAFVLGTVTYIVFTWFVGPLLERSDYMPALIAGQTISYGGSFCIALLVASMFLYWMRPRG